MKKISRKFDLNQLQHEKIARSFKVKIGEAFEPLLELDMDIEQLYKSFKEATNEITAEVAVYRKAKHIDGMSVKTSNLCERRRSARTELLNHPSLVTSTVNSMKSYVMLGRTP